MLLRYKEQAPCSSDFYTHVLSQKRRCLIVSTPKDLQQSHPESDLRHFKTEEDTHFCMSTEG